MKVLKTTYCDCQCGYCLDGMHNACRGVMMKETCKKEWVAVERVKAAMREEKGK